MKNVLRFASLMLATTAVPVVLLAELVHGVQVAAFQTQEEALAAVAALPDWSPKHVVSVESSTSQYRWKVVVGEFDTRAEAWANHQFMSDRRLLDGMLTTFEADARTSNSLPVKRLCNTAGLDPAVDSPSSDAYLLSLGLYESPESVAAGLLAGDLRTLQGDQLLQFGINTPDNAKGIQALNAYLATAPAGVEKDRATLRLARRLLREKNYEQAESLAATALQSTDAGLASAARYLAAYAEYYQEGLAEAQAAFLGIAGDTAVHPGLRRDSLRMAAGIAHRRGKFATSWMAFMLLHETACTDKMRSDAGAEIVGLAMELAHRQIGTMAEVQELSDRMRETSTPADAARVELMALEAMFYRNEYDTLLPKIAEFKTRHASQAREVATITVLEGATLSRKGLHDEARTVLEAVAQSELPEGARWGKVDQRAQALQWLVVGSEAAGRKEDAESYRGQLRARFPESDEARALQKADEEQQAYREFRQLKESESTRSSE